MSGERDPLLASAGLSSDQLAQVLALIAGTDIAELDVTVGGSHLRLRRPPLPFAPAQQPSDGTLTSAPLEPTTLAIASPLVGIFRPAVRAGDDVQPGQSIGAIEALGMPTSVDAPQGGIVEDVLVPDGNPVEFGQPLLTLRRTAHDGQV